MSPRRKNPSWPGLYQIVEGDDYFTLQLGEKSNRTTGKSALAPGYDHRLPWFSALSGDCDSAAIPLAGRGRRGTTG